MNCCRTLRNAPAEGQPRGTPRPVGAAGRAKRVVLDRQEAHEALQENPGPEDPPGIGLERMVLHQQGRQAQRQPADRVVDVGARLREMW